MAYRSSGPQVYEYNRSNYDQNPNQRTIIHGSEPRQPVQAQYERQHLRGSDYSNSGERYDDYRKNKSYKYNCFSMLDEPWNRCCEFGSCGNFPGNQCIAKNLPKLDWL